VSPGEPRVSPARESTPDPAAQPPAQPELFGQSPDRPDAPLGEPPEALEAPGQSVPDEVSPAERPSRFRERYDSIVVGAGIGGLISAALLARAGQSVLVLERAGSPGGVCRSVALDEQPVDVGTTLLAGWGANGPAVIALERLGIKLSTRPCDPILQVALPRHRVSLYAEAERWWAEIRRELPEDEAGWRALFSELDDLVRDREALARELPPLPPRDWRAHLRCRYLLTVRGLWGAGKDRVRAVQRALQTPFRATLEGHGLGGASRQVVDACLWSLLLRDADECSTLEAALALVRLRQGAVNIAGGAGGLVEALCARLARDGGELCCETPVRRCLVEKGRVVGVVTKAGDTIRARWVVADVPPGILAKDLLPQRRAWYERPRVLDGSWAPLRVAQGMGLTLPQALLPSELGSHCLVVQDGGRPARDENCVCVRVLAAPAGRVTPATLRCVCLGRFVAVPRPGDGATLGPALLRALDQIVPGVADACAGQEVLSSSRLEALWGRPSAAVRFARESQSWLGRQGMPHETGWPGLLAVGDWTHPGRLLADVVAGAMEVADVILAH
jgi:phytoene dehydrogenase-like protein